MRPVIKTFGLLLLFLVIFGWVFQADNFAVNKNYQYRQLANGWASFHAFTYLKENKGLIKKVKESIADDLTHGRFRPVFFLYITSSYALSPFVHGRDTLEEGRPYAELVNGDLRLFSSILLASIGLSFVFMSLLIYFYTKEIIFSFIPVFFIPLSPSLTENLLFNYIDSQAIPLVLWLSIWIFSFFMAIREQKSGPRMTYLLLSLLFLTFAFFTKETTVIVSVALAIIAALLFGAGRLGFKPLSVSSRSLLVVNLISSILLSVLVFTVIHFNRQGYAAAEYIVPATYGELKKAIFSLWKGLSIYSLNGYWGYIPILLFLLIAWKDRAKTLNGQSMGKHVALLFMLLLLCYGFLLILIPWKSLMIKYFFPGVFFFSFAVALALSLLARWAKEHYNRRGMVVYLVLPLYIFLYVHYAPQASINKKYNEESSAYGISTINLLAKSIAYQVKRNPTADLSVYIDYIDFGNDAPRWSAMQGEQLQLMRFLNLRHQLNIRKANGVEILNYRMPEAEFSSFRHYENHPSVFISKRKEDLQQQRFSVLYKAFPAGQKPLGELFFPESNVHYRLADESIEYYSLSQMFPEFTFYKYLPANGRSARQEFSRAAPVNLFSSNLLQQGAVDALHAVTVAVQKGELLLSPTGEDPQVLLPTIEETKGNWLVFKGDVYSSKKTTLQFFYKTRNKSYYSVSDSKSISLNKGEDTFYFILPACHSSGRIRMDPGPGDAKIILRSLQVREVRDS